MPRVEVFDWLGAIAVAALLIGFIAMGAGLPVAQRGEVQVAFLAACMVLFGFYGVHVGRQVRALERWRREGRCLKCGYTRDGLAANAPCPECGLVP